MSDSVTIRPANELDLDAIIAIDEKLSGQYRPDIWERRLTYYLRRDPDSSVVAEADGELLGFMLGEVRSGEFGQEEATGWIEVVGVDPDHRGRSVGRELASAMLDHFRRRGAAKVRTFVDAEREDLSAFFASLGFQPATLRPLVMAL
ncbi:MAG: GNAT family N-acetyltransferase [Thermoanaerobaculia bacterium]